MYLIFKKKPFIKINETLKNINGKWEKTHTPENWHVKVVFLINFLNKAIDALTTKGTD